MLHSFYARVVLANCRADLFLLKCAHLLFLTDYYWSYGRVARDWLYVVVVLHVAPQIQQSYDNPMYDSAQHFHNPTYAGVAAQQGGGVHLSGAQQGGGVHLSGGGGGGGVRNDNSVGYQDVNPNGDPNAATNGYMDVQEAVASDTEA